MNVLLPNARCVHNRQEDGTLACLENDPIASKGAIGAGERSRTSDLRITNALLYQLSYTGTFQLKAKICICFNRATKQLLLRSP